MTKKEGCISFSKVAYNGLQIGAVCVGLQEGNCAKVLLADVIYPFRAWDAHKYKKKNNVYIQLY